MQYDQHAGERDNAEPQWWQTEFIVAPQGEVTEQAVDPSIAEYEARIQAIAGWIDSQHTILWAMFNVGPEGDTRRAAVWFFNQVATFGEWLETQ